MHWKKVQRNNLGEISTQPHTTLCIQFLDRENNNKNNRLPLGKQICFTIVWDFRKSYHGLLCLLWKKKKKERKRERSHQAQGWKYPHTHYLMCFRLVWLSRTYYRYHMSTVCTRFTVVVQFHHRFKLCFSFYETRCRTLP